MNDDFQYIDEMIGRILIGDEDAGEALVELSLLVQREVRRNPSYDSMVEGVLGGERARRRLSAAEVAYATERLLDLAKTRPPNTLVVRALAATLDRRMLEPLLDLVDRYGDDPEQQSVVGAALSAFAPFRGTFDDDPVRRLAERCPDKDNREEARDFLDPATGYRREPSG